MKSRGMLAGLNSQRVRAIPLVETKCGGCVCVCVCMQYINMIHSDQCISRDDCNGVCIDGRCGDNGNDNH